MSAYLSYHLDSLIIQAHMSGLLHDALSKSNLISIVLISTVTRHFRTFYCRKVLDQRGIISILSYLIEDI